jgi:ABC-type enterochelin transport system substrate-binding protein
MKRKELNFSDYLKEEMEKSISEIKKVVIERNPDFDLIAKNEIDYLNIGYRLKKQYPSIKQAISTYQKCMELIVQKGMKDSKEEL